MRKTLQVEKEVTTEKAPSDFFPVTLPNNSDGRGQDERESLSLNHGLETESVAVSSRVAECLPPGVRPQVKGKFIFCGDKKLYIRGVTYGPFSPNQEGYEYPDPDVVELDFKQIAANGMNGVRTYTVPPRWLLDTAHRHGLLVMVGLTADTFATFLDDKAHARAGEELVRQGIRACAGHPAILCYTLGNEISASIVRWHRPRRIERYLEQLYWIAKAEDPGGLITYANYPSTEYLELPFLDFVCFNVFLESRDQLDAYLARLQHIAGGLPLILGEIGLDSRRHGEDAQARALDWQVRTAFGAGCAGAFVYSWTDEWHRGGNEIQDWDFGLTGRDRRPKLALATIRKTMGEVPFPRESRWPRISVVVCSYNGARTIRECFEGLLKLDYPDFEVIVVNDGSTDETAAIAQGYGFRVISTENRGLGSARNAGLKAATGEIVAYIDDDAYPDPHWLTYLAASFLNSNHAGIGGPNLSPPGDGVIADCVANAPGNPVHVLLSDREAEHIAGCNMAFRKSTLEAIGGFDPQFRVAGDDVDICWSLQQRGFTLGFSPAAQVWHHRRNSVLAFWRQQKNYGKAETLLEKKWPDKYNAAGHITWNGRLYGMGLMQKLGWFRGRIYQGNLGSAPFQWAQDPAPSLLWSLPMMPEWYLVIAVLAALSTLGALWRPLLAALPLLSLAVGALLTQAGLSATRASFRGIPRSRLALLGLRCGTAFLHLLQPLGRLRGRLGYGLTPWRRWGVPGLWIPRPWKFDVWTNRWQSPHARLESLEATFRAHGSVVLRGDDYDNWDLEVWDGRLGGVRMQIGVEEHSGGRQLMRFRARPRGSPGWVILTLVFVILSIGAGMGQAWIPFRILSVTALLLALRTIQNCAAAMFAVIKVLKLWQSEASGGEDQVH